MTKPIARDSIYKGRRFQSETIELCVRWYITYRLSYRDLAAMMAERGIVVSHTTIMRWVLRYVPEYEKRWGRFARPAGSSWRMDETAVSVRGGPHYLYRAVDKHGRSVGSLLCAGRDMDAARKFFRNAVAKNGFHWPTTVNLDGNAASHRALRFLGKEDSRWKSVSVRFCRYLNNVIEQDHRAIKRRCASMLGLKSFETAAIALAGIELAHRIRKGQFSLSHGCSTRTSSLRDLWDKALAPATSSASLLKGSQSAAPPMHQISRIKISTRPGAREDVPRRYARKIFEGRGLYLLVMPNGSRYWRYNYRFGGKHKTLALGVHPDVCLEKARARHQLARSLLADGIDPSARKRTSGKYALAARGEWAADEPGKNADRPRSSHLRLFTAS
jgi:transposase-like protein